MGPWRLRPFQSAKRRTLHSARRLCSWDQNTPLQPTHPAGLLAAWNTTVAVVTAKAPCYSSARQVSPSLLSPSSRQGDRDTWQPLGCASARRKAYTFRAVRNSISRRDGQFEAPYRLRGRRFTEAGQPSNQFRVLPRTLAWLRGAGRRIERVVAVGAWSKEEQTGVFAAQTGWRPGRWAEEARRDSGRRSSWGCSRR
jgi:hypothetical protein